MAASRQREYQLRHIELGLCVQCSRPAIDGIRFCEKHRKPAKRRNKKKGNGLSTLNCSRVEYMAHWRYGLSPDKFRKMVNDQDGRCAICGNESKRRSLSIDHCHKTGKIRGLLCGKCNSAIGLIGDSPDIAQKMVSYLTKNLK